MSFIMKHYERTMEVNAKIRKAAESTELIKRGILLKLCTENEQKDKLYYAQEDLLCQQMEDTANNSEMSFDEKSERIQQIITASAFLTKMWKKESDDFIAKMNQIIKE